MTDLREISALAPAVAASFQTGLLPALLEESSTAAGYADRLGLDPVATERVLDVLTAAGFAETAGETYAASAALREFDAHTPTGLRGAAALWGHTPNFLRNGQRFRLMDGTPGVREAAYKDAVGGLGRLFEEAARQLAAQLPGEPGRILDVGAGSGVWSLAMAANHPDAWVTAIDLPGVLGAFQARATDLGLTARVDVLPGDYRTVFIPAARYDRVVLANVLHLETPQCAALLIGRVAAALRPGGVLVIVDTIGDGTPDGELARAIYGLHLALRTDRGRAHPLGDLVGWLAGAGLVDVGVQHLNGRVRGLGALLARRPS